ncbi:MAG: glutamate racemase [Eubacterium sp.]|nr:glutamate racemase [Eubacterium sp.]
MAYIDNPVAVFDSGMGGISVLKEMVRLMPEEDFIYFGDSANAPYGVRPVEEVRKLTIDHISYFVEKKSAKAVAVACNTATSAAVRDLREMYPELPLVGVEPAIKPAVNSCDNPRILVMATPRTLAEEKFLNLEHIYEQKAAIFPLPCPGLMEFVEEGKLEGEELENYLHSIMDPWLSEELTGIVLGCTHYPFVKKAIQKVAGPGVEIFDGSLGTARELARRIRAAGLNQSEDHKGSVTFLNSSGDPSKLKLMEYLFRSNV